MQGGSEPSATNPVAEWIARQEVAAVLTRYASAIDGRDWGQLQSCFASRCQLDYGWIGAWDSSEAITDFMRQVHEPCGFSLHRITNAVVNVNTGDASARSYVDAIVMAAGNRAGTRSMGFYDDRLSRTDAGWQITHRTFTMVALEALDSELLIHPEPSPGA